MQSNGNWDSVVPYNRANGTDIRNKMQKRAKCTVYGQK
jgi:hypothetical protein